MRGSTRFTVEEDRRRAPLRLEQEDLLLAAVPLAAEPANSMRTDPIRESASGGAAQRVGAYAKCYALFEA